MSVRFYSFNDTKITNLLKVDLRNESKVYRSPKISKKIKINKKSLVYTISRLFTETRVLSIYITLCMKVLSYSSFVQSPLVALHTSAAPTPLSMYLELFITLYIQDLIWYIEETL